MLGFISSTLTHKNKLYFILFSIPICFFITCVSDSKEKNFIESQKSDRLKSLLFKSKSKEYITELRLQDLEEAYSLVNTLDNDSLKINYLFKISNQLYSLKEYKKFRKINSEFLNYAMEFNDSMKIADFYWNMGWYFSDKEVLDSAYYHYGKARDIFKDQGHNYYTAKMEYNIAYIFRRSKNYIESEAFALRSISNLKNSGKNLLMYRCYNHLGLLYNDLDQYSYSVEYHMKAMDLIDKLPKKGIFLERSLNNLSLVYQKQKKYQDAIKALNKALLNKDLQSSHPNLFAKLIDNRAYCKFLNGEEIGVLDDFNKALFIRDSLVNKAGVGISKMHLSEYYLAIGDTLKAFHSAKEAYDLAQSLELNRDKLSSLVLLSKVDSYNAEAYMNEYIQLNDSLLLEERKVRNKFTRIQFETEDHIAANEDLKIRSGWVTLTSIMTVVSLSMIIFGYRQKSQNKTLLLDQHQQKANQEIYDLMLKQQNREEEGRIQERIRISEGLHDGVLARLFSARIGFGLLNFISNQEALEQFHKLIDDLQLVEKEIRDISHALKTDELSSKKDFPKLLLELLEEQGDIGNFNYSLDKDDSIAWNQVDEKIKINLFRIVQEAVHNAIKYSKCKRVIVSLKRSENKVVLQIVDDGKGFDTNKKIRGIGLKNMKSRAQSIGAVIDIKSIPKEGTRIEVSISTKILYHEAIT